MEKRDWIRAVALLPLAVAAGCAVYLWLCVKVYPGPRPPVELDPPRPAPVVKPEPAQALIVEAPDAAELHNAWRHKVGVPPLRWSGELTEQAESRVWKMLESCRLEHAPDSKLGENLHKSSSPASPRDVVADWAAERRHFDPLLGCDATKTCGHYTQIVWKGTREVGCASGICSSGEQLSVCLYNPAGNVVGQKPY